MNIPKGNQLSSWLSNKPAFANLDRWAFAASSSKLVKQITNHLGMENIPPIKIMIWGMVFMALFYPH